MRSLFGARRIRVIRQRSRRSAAGSQLLEFALALPVLLMLVIGIWDFGSAFAVKQKLTNAAREGARIVVSTPMANPSPATGCSKTVPCSIVSAATAVQQYLTNANLDGSWISPSSPASSSTCPSGEWVYGAASGTSGPSLSIKADVAIAPDGTVVAATGAPPGSVKATQVTLTWPLKWKLGVLLPTSAFPTHLSATTVMTSLGGGCGDSIQ
jgi:Flp pilus assembly protein TadG